MFAIELNGTHVSKSIRATYRQKSWPKSRPDRVVVLPNVSEITHKREGEVAIHHERIPMEKYEGKPEGAYVSVSGGRSRSAFNPEAYSYGQLTSSTRLPFTAFVEVVG